MLETNKVLDPTNTGTEAENFRNGLLRRVIGQDEAISQVVSVYQTFIAGMSSLGRPICNLLFLGPTGTGKTRLVEAVAESLVGDLRAVIKIDCGEFQHSHEIAKLIGSPPGYLGHRETPPMLSQEVLNQFHTDKVKISFVLFDEIEKANDALWSLLLGVLDKATLTLGDNRRVSFERAMIFLTSNLGSSEMAQLLSPRMGFGPSQARTEKLSNKISEVALAAARRKFTPEFMNRIDKAVVFKQLGPEHLSEILAIELFALQERIFTSQTAGPFVFQVTPAAREYLLYVGTDTKYGARHLKRAIERLLVNPLSNLVISRQVTGGDLVKVGFVAGSETLTFVKEAESLPAYTMEQMVYGELGPLKANAAAVSPSLSRRV